MSLCERVGAKRTQLPERDRVLRQLPRLVLMMELSRDPARAQADYTMIYVPEAAAFWLSSTTAPRAPGRRLDDQDASFATTGGTRLLIRSDSLAIAACAVFRRQTNAWGTCGAFHREPLGEEADKSSFEICKPTLKSPKTQSGRDRAWVLQRLRPTVS
jgi:hypothetical protein